MQGGDICIKVERVKEEGQKNLSIRVMWWELSGKATLGRGNSGWSEENPICGLWSSQGEEWPRRMSGGKNKGAMKLDSAFMV